jgi:hypothetical protein
MPGFPIQGQRGNKALKWFSALALSLAVAPFLFRFSFLSGFHPGGGIGS